MSKKINNITVSLVKFTGRTPYVVLINGLPVFQGDYLPDAEREYNSQVGKLETSLLVSKTQERLRNFWESVQEITLPSGEVVYA